MSEGDAELVIAFRQGDPSAFALLIERHRPRAVALARRLLADEAAAQDVAQEATYHAYLDISRLREPSQFGSWLCGIAVNLAKMAKRAERPSLSLDWLAGGQHVFGFRLADAVPSPEVAIEALDLRERLEDALTSLPVELRSTVWMHYVQGLTYQEISALTGMPAGTLRALSFRARQQLRRELADEWRERTRRREVDMVEFTVADVRIFEQPDGARQEDERTPPSLRITGPRWTVILREKAGNRALVIWIGAGEGQAIATHLAGLKAPRPATYTFITNLLDLLAAKVSRVEITELVQDTFFANVTLRAGRRTLNLDARPSDALNVALRTGAPIFVADSIVDRVGLAWDETLGAKSSFSAQPTGRPAPSASEEITWKSGVAQVQEDWRLLQERIAAARAEAAKTQQAQRE